MYTWNNGVFHSYGRVLKDIIINQLVHSEPIEQQHHLSWFICVRIISLGLINHLKDHHFQSPDFSSFTFLFPNTTMILKNGQKCLYARKNSLNARIWDGTTLLSTRAWKNQSKWSVIVSKNDHCRTVFSDSPVNRVHTVLLLVMGVIEFNYLDFWFSTFWHVFPPFSTWKNVFHVEKGKKTCQKVTFG